MSCRRDEYEKPEGIRGTVRKYLHDIFYNVFNYIVNVVGVS